jgi:Gpi18-like mannosyltransferase
VRNHFLIITGLILCILSRYTLVFWLPLFAYIYFKEYDLKRNIVLWGSVAGSILLLYFPFLLKDPTILAKGVAYHNQCAIGLLQFASDGVHFANFIDRNTQGDEGHTVMIIRIIQFFSMVLLNAFGIFMYHRFRNIHALDIAALFLYIIVLSFFLTSPMVFYYYYLVTFTLLGALWARVEM